MIKAPTSLGEAFGSCPKTCSQETVGGARRHDGIGDISESPSLKQIKGNRKLHGEESRAADPKHSVGAGIRRENQNKVTLANHR